MTSTEAQHQTHLDGFHHSHSPSSDERINAHSFARRPENLSASPVAATHRAGRSRIPPPAPSPPVRYARPAVSSIPPDIPQSQVMATELPDRLSQWLFTDEEIDNSPSVCDGLDPIEERARRAKGVNFIVQAGILLKIPQLTLGTASVFFHRFYMRFSMVAEKGGLHHYVRQSLPRSRSSQSLINPLTVPSPEQTIAATALFLATKAEENCRKTKEIVIAVAKVAQKNASLVIDEQSKEFWRWKDSILLHEETMLEYLTFDVVLESPYTCLYNFLRELEIEHNKNLRNVAWAFLNDSCMTTLCLRVSPKEIAAAAIYFSAKYNRQRILDDDSGTPWWIRINANEEKMQKAIEVMHDFYVENPLKRSDNPLDQSPSAEDLEATRQQRYESTSPMARRHAEESEVEDDQREMNGHGDESHAQNVGRSEAGQSPVAGDDDANLKVIANDPATHEAINGGTNGTPSQAAAKRKGIPVTEIRAAEGSETKRMKREESEEGEVEE